MKRLRKHRILFLCLLLKILLPAAVNTESITRPPGRHVMKPTFIMNPIPLNVLRWNLTLEDAPIPSQTTPDWPHTSRAKNLTTKQESLQKKYPAVIYVPDSTIPSTPAVKNSPLTKNIRKTKPALTLPTTTSSSKTILNTTIHASAKAELIIRPNFMSKGNSAGVVPAVVGSPSDYSPAFIPPLASFPAQGLPYHTDPFHAVEYGSGGGDAPMLTKIDRYYFTPVTGPPSFPLAKSYFAYVREDAALGTRVITVKAEAPANGIANYEIVRGNERGSFQIDLAGCITVSRPLDRELVDGYNLTIRASDYSGHDCFSPVFIRVVDVNDHAPVISNNIADHFIAPCGVANAHVGTIHATDADVGRNGQVYFCLDQDHSNLGLFYIDPMSGAIATLTELPAQPDHYILAVTAKDQGIDLQRKTEIQVTVFVQCQDVAVIPLPPQARQPIVCQNGEPTTITLPFGTPAGTTVATVTAASGDGRLVVFTLLPGRETAFFQISPTSGQVRITAPLTDAVYLLHWEARDSFGQACSGNLNVQVVPVNVAPQFSAPTYQFVVSQCGQTGVTLGTVHAADQNVGSLGQVVYSSPDLNFLIDSRSGSISLKHAVQPTPVPYIFQVVATDGGGLYSVVNVTMTVQCATQAPPTSLLPPAVVQFLQPTFVFDIQCGIANAQVGRIMAFSSRNDAVTYSVLPNPATFVVHPTTGMLSTTNPLPAKPTTYAVVALATSTASGQMITAQVTVTINVVCHLTTSAPTPLLPAVPPQCAPGPIDAILLASAAPGTPVATVRSMPRPVGSSPIQYSIPEVAFPMLHIDPQTGMITVQSALTAAFLANGGAAVLVRATDVATGLFCTIPLHITIKVPNNPPIFSENSYFFEVGCLGSTDIVGYVHAGDVDTGVNGELNYFLDGPDSTFFSIDQNGNIRPAGELTHTAYSLMVTVRDGGSAMSQAPVRIAYHCPGPVQCPPTGGVAFDVSENAPAGTRIGSVSALGTDLSYQLLTPGSDVLFAVHPQTGVVSLKQPVRAIQSTPAPSASRTANLIIRVTDGRRHFCDISVFINVNFTINRPPVFDNSSYTFVVGCSRSPGTLAGIVRARETTGNIPPELTYDVGGVDARFFSVSPLTGELRFRDAPLDRFEFRATVGATVLGGLRAEAAILVFVNCQPMQCPSGLTLQIPEDLPVGNAIGQIPPINSPNGGPVGYRLVLASSVISVVVNPQSGSMTLAQPIPPAAAVAPPGLLMLVVTAFNSVGQACNITVQVSVTRRLRPPEFVGAPYVFTLMCNQLSNVVGRVTAVFAGSFQPAAVAYSITQGDRRFLNIDEVSGEIRITGNATQGRMPLQVTARDANGLTTHAYAEIVIPPCPLDCPPVLRSQVREDAQRGAGVTFVSIASALAGNDVTYRFSDAFTSSEVGGYFSIDQRSGAVTLNHPVDGRGGQVFQIPIIAISSSRQECEMKLEIGVVRRSPPSLICPPPQGVDVRQNAEIGSFLTKVSVGEPGDFCFSLTEMSGAGGFFEIERMSGILRVASQLFSLPPRTYTLAVRASLKQDVTQFCDTAVAVTVQLFNTSLQCSTTPIMATVDQTSSVYDTVAIVRVGSPNGLPLSFAIAEPYPPIITLNQTSGVVMLSRGFLNATRPQYQFVIRASDYYGAFCDTTLLLNIPPFNRPPVFSSAHYQFTTTCGPQNSFVGVVSANDIDHDRLTFDLSPDEFFTIDQLGSIRTRVPILTVIPRQILTAGVTDIAGAHCTAQVTIIFNGIGCGSPPVCSQPVYRYDMPPYSTVGTTVGKVSALDPDGDRLSYVISGPDQYTFGVDPSTGEIRLLQTLGPTSQTAYQFSVRASSAANAFCEMTIQVTVRTPDAPRFVRPTYNFEVPCGTISRAACLGSVSTTGGKGEVRYSVSSDSVVTVGQMTGEVCLRDGLPRSQSTQSAVVSAVDFISGATTTTTVTISFQACQRAPVCFPTSLTSAVNEVDPIGTRVQQVSVSDPDVGDTLSFAITSGNADNIFSISPQEGIVTVNRPLDRETVDSYQLQIAVSDSAGLTCGVRLDIAIIDNNDNVPVFTRPSYAFTVPCHTPMAFVGSVTAIDADVGMNARVQYSTAPNGPITIDSETGEMRTRVPLDIRPADGPYTVTVYASDSGSPQRTATTSVRILANCTTVAEGPICPPPSSVQVRENSVRNTLVTQVTAQDPRGQILRYSLTGLGSDRFDVTASGQVIVVGHIDRETSLNPFSLSVLVQNAAGQSCTTLLTITILDENDQIPSFVGANSFSVDCGIPSSTVGTVRAVDGDTGQNAHLEYSILGTTDFVVDSQTGEIRTLRPLNGQPTVREVTVAVNDRGNPRRTAQTLVRITVRQNCPVATPVQPVLQCQDNYAVRIRDDANIGAEVAPISLPRYTNSAAGIAPVFGIVQGNEQGLFQINSQTGRLTVAKSLLPGTLEFIVGIRVGAQTCTSRVVLTIVDENDNNPVFQQPFYNFQVPCGNAGTVGRTTATDPDQGLNGVVSFSLIGTSSNFAIDPRSGEIRATSLLPTSPLTYQLTAVATDGGQPRKSGTATVTITVRCQQDTIHPTPFNSLSYLPPLCPDPLVMEVEENRAGAVIGTVRGRDSNPGGVLRYSLLPTADSRFFQVDTVANEGRLTVVAPLDRESEATFIVDVRIMNNYAQSCETPVRVNVLDVNDNLPVFSHSQYQFQTDCAGPPPWTVGSVEARDGDTGVNGVVLYSAPANQPLAINPSTGVITLLNLLTAAPSNPTILTTEISATNPIPPRQSSTVTIKVILAPACFALLEAYSIPYDRALVRPAQLQTANHPPHCQGLGGSTGDSVQISENTQTGTFLTAFQAADADNDDRLIYHVSSGDPDRHFLLDPSTGEIFVNGHLDRESRDFYNLTISAVDIGGLSCSRPIFIRLTDRNDNAPEVLNMQPLVAVVNCSTPDAWVVQVDAIDRDTGPNAMLNFALDPTSGFHISNRGQIRTTIGLPRDPPARFIPVVISDSGEPSLSTTVTLTVNVLCPAPPTPIFEQQYYCAGIKEHSPANSEITRVTARYPDSRTDISYVLRSGNSSLFSVDPQTGVIRSRVTLDAENFGPGDNTLVVGTLQNNRATPDAYSVVFVNILDENDHSPQFEEVYRVSVAATTPVDSALLRVRAFDADKTFPNNYIRGYEISGDEGLRKLLRVDSSGELILTSPLTALLGQAIPMRVIAVDGGNPPRTGTTVVELSIV